MRYIAHVKPDDFVIAEELIRNHGGRIFEKSETSCTFVFLPANNTALGAIMGLDCLISCTKADIGVLVPS